MNEATTPDVNIFLQADVAPVVLLVTAVAYEALTPGDQRLISLPALELAGDTAGVAQILSDLDAESRRLAWQGKAHCGPQLRASGQHHCLDCCKLGVRSMAIQVFCHYARRDYEQAERFFMMFETVLTRLAAEGVAFPQLVNEWLAEAEPAPEVPYVQ